MKTISRQQNYAPRGVIISDKGYGESVAFVGRAHGMPLVLSDDLVAKIKAIGDRSGYWYEGAGGDIETTTNFNRRSIYKGSWDDKMMKSISGYPMEYLFAMFSNWKESGTNNVIVDPVMTIFQSIMKRNRMVGYLQGRSYSESTLTAFLKECSEKGIDFLQLAEKPATSANVIDFLSKGEKLMWPSNWESYPNKAGKLAQKANKNRDTFLARQRTGVYFAGSGHLPEITRLSSSLKMIDGRDAAR